MLLLQQVCLECLSMLSEFAMHKVSTCFSSLEFCLHDFTIYLKSDFSSVLSSSYITLRRPNIFFYHAASSQPIKKVDSQHDGATSATNSTAKGVEMISWISVLLF